MRSIYVGSISVFIFSVVFVQNAFCGAWTVPKYKVWGEYFMAWKAADKYFYEDGRRENMPNGAKYWEFTMEPKLEYGVTDWFTALGSIEYKQSHYKEYDRPAAWGTFVRKNNGISNFKFGGRLRFIKEPVVVSAQTKVSLYPGYGNFHGDDPAFTNQPSIGRGDDAIEERIMVSKSAKIPLFGSFELPVYASAETGYRWRTRHACNDIPYFVEGGFWPTQWLLLKAEVDGYKSHGATGSIKEDYGICRVGAVWQIFGDSTLREGDKLFNIEFQYGALLWGKSTNASEELVVKVQTQF